MQNIVFTVELLGSQQIALKENERANVDLLRKVSALSNEKREADKNPAGSRLTWTANSWPNEAGRVN